MTSGADSQSMEIGNADSKGKRPVWNVPPSNGAIKVSPVVDSASWPALSESTKPSIDSPKSFPDSGLLTLSSCSLKPSNSNNESNPDAVKNSLPPTRQKSLKHGNSSVNHASQSVVTTPEPSPRSSSSGNNDQHRTHINTNRRGNNGGGPHQNHGTREGNNYRNGPHMNRGGFRTYHRPQQFMAQPSPLSHPIAANPMGFPDFAHPMYFGGPPQYPEAIRGMPFVPHHIPHQVPNPLFFPILDPQRAALLKQIEYYFSSENLCKDMYLRSQMDEQGWVHVTLIAGFPKVQELTNNIHYILETIRSSSLVEVQGEKLRRRNDWMVWRVVALNQNNNGASTNISAVTSQFGNVSINGGSCTRSNNVGFFTRSGSGYLNNQYSSVTDSARGSAFLSRSDTF